MDTNKINMKEVIITSEKLQNFIKAALLKAGVRDDVASYVSEGLIQTSLRGVDSHGIRLLPHYLSAVKGGRINKNPNFKFKKTSASTGLLDADHTFGHAAGMEAAKKAVELAKEAGSAQIAVYNSTHFGAAAYYALEIANNDMIGMSFTNTDALIKSYGGKRPFLGNDPICVAIPCKDEEPFCLDMATSVITFNKVRQYRDNDESTPQGVGADSNGVETTNPHDMTMLLPIGGYKGYGLSAVVEIFCSLLTGMPFGPHIPKMFEAPLDEKRFLGHFVSAMRIDCFQEKDAFKERMTTFMNELRNEPPFDSNKPIMVAGDPEKKVQAKRMKEGIPVSDHDYKKFQEISREYNLPFDSNE